MDYNVIKELPADLGMTVSPGPDAHPHPHPNLGITANPSLYPNPNPNPHPNPNLDETASRSASPIPIATEVCSGQAWATADVLYAVKADEREKKQVRVIGHGYGYD